MKFGIVPEQGIGCGCDDREGHVEPHIDPDLGLEHGERSALNDDPLPHLVPDSGYVINGGLYGQDAYCLCGHPQYLSCLGFLNGGSITGAILYDADAL